MHGDIMRLHGELNIEIYDKCYQSYLQHKTDFRENIMYVGAKISLNDRE